MRETDNRDLTEVIKYQEARIEALSAEIRRLKTLVRGFETMSTDPWAGQDIGA